MFDMVALVDRWYAAKKAEKEIVEKRREIEDQISKILLDDDSLTRAESHTRQVGRYALTVSTRVTHKIDANKLQEIAAEQGTSEHLSTLFRWKPEINKKIWEATDETILTPLKDAITTTPGRASYSVKIKKED